MKITFMGTGAAEAIPAIGCQCLHCREARLKGGRMARKRSSVLIKLKDANILLDSHPEIQQTLNKYNINDIKAIFLSHRHFDHTSGLHEFKFWNKTINFYGGKDVIPIAKKYVKSEERKINKNFHFYELKDKQAVNLKNLKIIPFEVEHKVPTFGFLFEENGKKLMHFSDSTARLSYWQIEQMQKANIVVFHTTTYDKIASDHISVKDVLNLISRYKIENIVLTHINHKNLTHQKLVRKLSPYSNIVVAYDGLEITI